MEYGALMEMAVRAGEIMLASGAEVYRVEDTIHRILKHSGIARADVFVVTTGIVATIADASLPPLTLVKRVENRATNLNRIDIIRILEEMHWLCGNDGIFCGDVWRRSGRMPGGGCRGSRSCVCPAGGVQPYAE